MYTPLAFYQYSVYWGIFFVFAVFSTFIVGMNRRAVGRSECDLWIGPQKSEKLPPVGASFLQVNDLINQ